MTSSAATSWPSGSLGLLTRNLRRQRVDGWYSSLTLNTQAALFAALTGVRTDRHLLPHAWQLQGRGDAARALHEESNAVHDQDC
jgi:hypothetical protein